MPIKSTTPKLMYSLDGKNFQDISEIKLEDELKTTTLADSPSLSDVLFNPCGCNLTFDIKTSHPKISRILYSLYGKSNNWLRLHGYPMIRKARR